MVLYRTDLTLNLFRIILSSFSSYSPGELDILGHDGNSLGVDGAQVGVLKETNQVGLASLLQSHDSAGLESQVSLEVLGNLPDQTLEGKLADQEFSGLLVTSDLTESNGTGPVTVGLLNTAGGGRGFSGGFGGQLFAGSLSAGGFTCSLLGTSHGESKVVETKLNQIVKSRNIYTSRASAETKFFLS